MATRYAVATGNWSATTTWDGGTLPTSSDDVYADGKTVTIDQDVTVLSLRTTARSGGTAGGGFACSTARTINATGTGIVAGSSSCLTLSHAAGTTVTVGANVAGNTTNGSTLGGIVLSSTGTTNVTGNIQSGNIGGHSAGILITAGHTLSVTGNLTNANGNSSIGYDFAIRSTVAATITVTGSVTGTSTGDTANSRAIEIAGGSTLTVTGNLSAGSIGPAVVSTGNSTITITGTITSNSSIVALQGNTSTLVLSGPFVSSATGYLPFTTTGITKLTGITGNEFRFLKSTGGTASLWSSDVNSGAPSAANVRSGTTFGVSNEFTGTLAVPAAASVSYGVPVDNTTGTAALAPSDIAAVVGAQIAAALDSTP